MKAGADFAIRKPHRMAEYRTTLNKILAREKRNADERHDEQRSKSVDSHSNGAFKDMQLSKFDDNTEAAIYILDYNWTYLFANAQAKKNTRLRRYRKTY